MMRFRIGNTNVRVHALALLMLARSYALGARAEMTAMTPLQRAGAFLRSFGVEIIAGIIFTAIAFVGGCVQYMVVGHVDLATAVLTAVAPFMVVDLCKIEAAVICADAVRAAVR